MKEIIDLFSRYEGEIIQDKNEIAIIANNTIIDSGGKKHERIKCEVNIHWGRINNYPFCLSAEEKTYQILGGMGCPCDDLDEALKIAEAQLDRFGFRKKLYEEVTLF